MKQILIIILCTICTIAFSDNNEINNSIVKIATTSNGYNYKTPWQAPYQYEITGSGFVIEGLKILTNAHIVANAAYIEVVRTDNTTPYRAEVELIDHECDLAILKVNDKKFFENVQPLQFGQMPHIRDKVYALGFPIGGDEISITEGVISRIEVGQYAHSGRYLPLVQIDAAVNAGNSGGPVIHNNLVVGIVNQVYQYGQNIGYMIPVDVVKHFLRDAQQSNYKGFPYIGIMIQPLENPALRSKYGLPEGLTGILIVDINTKIYTAGLIKPKDIILAIDDYNIANNGTILLNNNVRIRADYLIMNKFIGDRVKIDLWRNNQKLTINYLLESKTKDFELVPETQYDVKPIYFIYAGLVFQTLTANYLHSFGEDWNATAPLRLLYYYRHGKKLFSDHNVVVLNRILPDDVNLGYQLIRDLVITEVNDHKIYSLKDLVQEVEASNAKYLIFKSEEGEEIILDRQIAQTRHQVILNNYNILHDRSYNFIKSE